VQQVLRVLKVSKALVSQFLEVLTTQANFLQLEILVTAI
jgi:hypothetical protein